MSVTQREAAYAGAYRAYIAVYYLLCAAICAYYMAISDTYHTLISLGTLIVPPGLTLMHRLLKLRRSYQLDMLIMGFVTLAYPLGACIDLYRRLPGFDKLAHCLSGVFVTALCIILFLQLKPDPALTPADMPLILVFSFFGSIAVAGLWEVGEFIISGIVKIDLQRIISTGIVDSMHDIIVCLIGTIVALPTVPRLINGKEGILASPIRAFTELNAPKV